MGMEWEWEWESSIRGANRRLVFIIDDDVDYNTMVKLVLVQMITHF
jgi:hypothetical protein